MRGDHTVAGATRHRSSVDVTGAECHRPPARAVQDDVAFSLARKFDSAHGPGIGPSPRLYVPFAVERSRPRSLEQHLRKLRFRVHPGTTCGAQHAGDCERTDEDEALLHFQLRTAMAAA